jgi:hypothetical protein
LSPTPLSWDDASWYRLLIQRLRYGAGLHNRTALADIVAATIRAQVDLPAPRAGDAAARDERVASLRINGFCRLGGLIGKSAVEAIVNKLENCPLRDELGSHEGVFTRQTAPADVNTATVDASDALSRCPHLLEAANHPDILDVVQTFLGAPPTVQYYTAWWSLAGREVPREAQLFHYDRNCFRFVKLFIYLTDVDLGGGPHVYVRGSADVGDWTRRLEIAKRDDPENAPRFLEMINAVRKNHDDVSDFFGADRLETFVGRAGEAFLVDTSGIHKGLVPRDQDRLAFQATYALLPELKLPPSRVARRDLFHSCGALYGDRVDPAYLRYVNRIAVEGVEG